MSQEDRPAWRALLEAERELAAADPASRFVSLATVRSDGRPAVRTVVFRGFAPDSNSLLFTTDLRSSKTEQLQARSDAEVCWYLAGPRIQWRIAGRVRLQGGGAPVADEPLDRLRLEAWESLSEDSHRQFAGPAPGSERTQAAAPASTPTVPPDYFGLMVLKPASVDVLELAQTPHRRTFHRLDEEENWTSRQVNA
jgi:PPOX class probable FMN-dependent enzyme